MGTVCTGCEGSSRPEMRLISEAGTESDLRGTDLFGAEEDMLAYWVSVVRGRAHIHPVHDP